MSYCECGHHQDEHDEGVFDCNHNRCRCDTFILLGPKPSRFDPQVVAEAINLPVEEWPGQCYGVAKAMLDAGLVPDGAIHYGFWHGVIVPSSRFGGRALVHHGWIQRDNGTIVDPTRWVFEDVQPYVYEDYDPDGWYDEGGNLWRAFNRQPAPAWEAAEPQKHYRLGDEAARHVANLLGHEGLTFSVGQRFWLLNLPLGDLQPYAKEIFEAAIAAGDGAILPIDNRRLVTNK